MVAFVAGNATEINGELPVVVLSAPLGLSVPMIARTLNPPEDCGTNEPSPGAPTTNQLLAVFQSVLTSPCQNPPRAWARSKEFVAINSAPRANNTREILTRLMVVPPLFE